MVRCGLFLTLYRTNTQREGSLGGCGRETLALWRKVLGVVGRVDCGSDGGGSNVVLYCISGDILYNLHLSLILFSPSPLVHLPELHVT